MNRPKEWLTYKIAASYRARAEKIEQQAIKKRLKLEKELIDRCGVTELEALNIISGHCINDYVAKYQRMKEEYQDILIHGEKPVKQKRIRCKYMRPYFDPNQIKLNTSQPLPEKGQGQ